MRALQTAGHLATMPDLAVTAMPELAEAGIGKHEGTNDPAIRARTAEVLRPYTSETERRRALPHWLHTYNHHGHGHTRVRNAPGDW